MNATKNTTRMLLLAILLTAGGCIHNPQNASYMTEWKAMPGVPGPAGQPALGVSAPFAGIHRHVILVAGGCNFPDKPVAEGGSKKFYDEIVALDLSQGDTATWQETGKLPYPVAYGASASTQQGIVCIGGSNSQQSLNNVLLLQWNPDNRQTEIRPLPSLPVPIDNMGATAINDGIYVVGGICDGKPSNRLFYLDLGHPKEGWRELPPIPGAARIQPVVVAQQGKDIMLVYVAGGFQPANGEQAPVVSTDVWSYNPQTQAWKKESDIPLLADGLPQTLTGGCGVPFEKDGILLAGGVNYSCFVDAIDRDRQIKEAERRGDTATVSTLKEQGKTYLTHPEAWYRFNQTLLLYYPTLDLWKDLGDHPQLARAGAGAVMDGNDLYIINGERKPGIRTPEVNRATVTISQNKK